MLTDLRYELVVDAYIAYNTFSVFLLLHFEPVDYLICNVKLNLYIPFTDSPDTEGSREQVLGMKEMLVPIAAGVLSALRRVIARRVSLKVLKHSRFLVGQIKLWFKKQMHFITCFYDFRIR